MGSVAVVILAVTPDAHPAETRAGKLQRPAVQGWVSEHRVDGLYQKLEEVQGSGHWPDQVQEVLDETEDLAH